MEIEILAHGNTKPEKVEMFHKAAKFYIKYLNIQKFKYKVYICLAPKMREKDGNNGVCGMTGKHEISVAVDSALDTLQSLTTLAHEMVHAKQYIRGQYRGELSRNGKMKRIWLGKSYSVSYLKRPWEKEAFRREGELACALLDNVIQKSKKRNKK